MKAVWLVRSRQLLNRMRFWTAIVGYDPYDRSISHHIYLVYVIIFFSIWGFSMLALFADLVAGVFTRFSVLSPIHAAIVLSAVILLSDALLQGYRHTRRSPFTFSEEDAVLICQTPADRRQVALAWLMGDWIPAGIPYWAGAITLSFVCQQLAAHAEMRWSELPIYILTGLRAVSVVLPLHLALMTSTYVLGVLRLREDRELPYLWVIPLGIGIILLLLVKFYPAALPILLWPMLMILEAGFGDTIWITGFVLAVILAALSLLVLYLISAKLNLSRASQESNIGRAIQQTGISKVQV